MQVDISFEFAKIYNIQKWVHVVKCQKFSLFTDATTPILFFSDNDPVLGLSANGASVDMEATNLGDSTLLIMDEGHNILKELVFSVVDLIIEPAKDLGINADKPEPK